MSQMTAPRPAFAGRGSVQPPVIVGLEIGDADVRATSLGVECSLRPSGRAKLRAAVAAHPGRNVFASIPVLAERLDLDDYAAEFSAEYGVRGDRDGEAVARGIREDVERMLASLPKDIVTRIAVDA